MDNSSWTSQRQRWTSQRQRGSSLLTLLESPGPDQCIFGLGLCKKKRTHQKKGPKKLKLLHVFDEQLIFGDFGNHFVMIWSDR